MRKTQAIFRAVIRAGHYPTDGIERFMCLRLTGAMAVGTITEAEATRAQRAIYRYMRKVSGVMRLYLRYHMGDRRGDYTTWVTGAGRDFYWNWDQRPRKTNNE